MKNTQGQCTRKSMNTMRCVESADLTAATDPGNFEGWDPLNCIEKRVYGSELETSKGSVNKNARGSLKTAKEYAPKGKWTVNGNCTNHFGPKPFKFYIYIYIYIIYIIYIIFIYIHTQYKLYINWQKKRPNRTNLTTLRSIPRTL